MTKIYICSKIAKRRILKLFRIRHLFILDSKGNRYEVINPNKIIKINHTKENLKILKNLDYKIINIPYKVFKNRLVNAVNLFEGKKYSLFRKNCYDFVKTIINYPICNISIGLIGHLY